MSEVSPNCENFHPSSCVNAVEGFPKPPESGQISEADRDSPKSPDRDPPNSSDCDSLKSLYRDPPKSPDRDPPKSLDRDPPKSPDSVESQECVPEEGGELADGEDSGDCANFVEARLDESISCLSQVSAGSGCRQIGPRLKKFTKRKASVSDNSRSLIGM
jgi:hypothetical protein